MKNIHSERLYWPISLVNLNEEQALFSVFLRRV